jgi:hypothetical protein
MTWFDARRRSASNQTAVKKYRVAISEASRLAQSKSQVLQLWSEAGQRLAFCASRQLACILSAAQSKLNCGRTNPREVRLDRHAIDDRVTPSLSKLRRVSRSEKFDNTATRRSALSQLDRALY